MAIRSDWDWRSENKPFGDKLRGKFYLLNIRAHVLIHKIQFLYEPFFVAPDNNPKHDERFIGYGYTRNTQVYEMFVAGFQFQVLTPLFTIHWGLQHKKGRPAWREHQNNINRKHFEIFKREVFARYHKDPLKMLVPKKKSRGPLGGSHVANAGGVGIGWMLFIVASKFIINSHQTIFARPQNMMCQKLRAWLRVMGLNP